MLPAVMTVIKDIFYLFIQYHHVSTLGYVGMYLIAISQVKVQKGLFAYLLIIHNNIMMKYDHPYVL